MIINRQRLGAEEFSRLSHSQLQVIAMVLKNFQDWMETKSCARVYSEGTDLWVRVDPIIENKDAEVDDEDLCLDDTETVVYAFVHILTKLMLVVEIV